MRGITSILFISYCHGHLLRSYIFQHRAIFTSREPLKLIDIQFLVNLLFCLGETNLSAKFDVIRVDLQASEQFKSVSILKMLSVALEVIEI